MVTVQARLAASRAVLRTYVIGAVLGAAVGMFSVGYLGVALVANHVIWDVLPENVDWVADHRALSTIAICTTGGVLVGLLNRRSLTSDRVHDLEETISETTHESSTTAAGWALLASLGIVSLAFGGSLGPEASLLAVVTTLAVRLRGILHLSRDEAVQLSMSAAVGSLFGAPLGAVALPIDGAPPTTTRERLERMGPSLVAALTGLATLVLVLPDGTLDSFSLPDRYVSLSVGVVLCAVAAALAGAAASLLLHAGLDHANRLVTQVMPSRVLRGAAGGLVLGSSGAVTALVLFSGHDQIQQLIDSVDDRTTLVLLGIAALKCVAVIACLATGWFGGEIFPAAMVGAALGLAVAVLVGPAAVGACVTAGMVAAAAVIMRRPIAALLILIFFVPSGTLAAAVIGAAVAFVVLAVAGAGRGRTSTPRPGSRTDRDASQA